MTMHSMKISSAIRHKCLNAPTLKTFMYDEISNVLPKDVLCTSEDNIVAKKHIQSIYCLYKIGQSAKVKYKLQKMQKNHLRRA